MTNPASQAPGLRIERHESAGSTNTLAFERARAGDPGNLWIRADRQTTGRGRLGRSWSSPKGNLSASLLLIDPQPRERIGELPLVAAVALADALDKAAGTFGLAKLKWPNDLLVDGAKLSGILLEAEHLSNGKTAVVLGIGVNCVAHPQDGLYPCTDLAALGYRVSADLLFDRLCEALKERLASWREPGGFSVIRRDWIARAAHKGQHITVKGPRELTGRFLDLDERGYLVLELENGGKETIYAGDVFLPGFEH
ncbi:BirA family biotin operon repressor/biotin-[acetyl-CoA-carboxylase] ligase [Roseibium hamelinense]|uniref:biotin--[biotin carboxyl-carrier protein] ligase n=1 Tax=Roseibium hamelinense TaxID=150831 RepID=A0A562TGT0_9HYPH|nr:biotin--[acetyl-CoA-carboxylase] ligase [Roseibium hamelinense]MTI45982.1 biotin--[acetyl-CoA-carboxylase] ligase [Roseibium hamelinense]TWI92829.1 BirA family biotin operon repressor/biotin-[acetyl-CoA-carboxylase] ligase [Roseibium hamelinense]